MEIEVQKQALLTELALLNNVVEKRTTIPVLSNILIETGDGGINLTGTSLDTWLITFADAEIKKPGAVAVPAKKFMEIVRSLPDSPIKLKTDENLGIQVTCDRSKFKLTGLPNESFPEVHQAPDGGLSLNPFTWNEMVERCAYAITAAESRYALNSALVSYSGTSLRLVATDGHRLAFVEATGEYGNAEPDTVLIPKNAFARSADFGTGATLLRFSRTEKGVFFTAGKRTLGSSIASGQFPNYEMVLPKDNKIKVVVDAPTLAAAIKRASLMADERSSMVLLTFADNAITIQAQSSEAGEAETSVPVEYADAKIALGFNSAYLLDALAQSNGNMEIHLKDGNSQVLMTVEGEKRWDMKAVIMPIRLT